nr:Uncharacterised protein [Klebsiella pneumoniae]
MADSTPLYARAIIMPLATIVILFWLDWRLAIATLGVLAFDRLFSCSPASVRKIWLSVIIRRASRLARR